MKPSIRNLTKLAQLARASLEEDHGSLDVRTLQLVAPAGKRWKSNQFISTPVLWARREAILTSARRFNLYSFTDACQVIEAGLEDIPEIERGYYADQ